MICGIFSWGVCCLCLFDPLVPFYTFRVEGNSCKVKFGLITPRKKLLVVPELQRNAYLFLLFELYR